MPKKKITLEDAREMIRMFVSNELDNYDKTIGDDHPYEVLDCTIGDIARAYDLLVEKGVL